MNSSIERIYRAIIALTVTMGAAVSVAGQPAARDFSPDWVTARGVTQHDTGGPGPSGTFASLDAAGATWSARLDGISGTTDFFIEFYLRMSNATNQPLHLSLNASSNAPAGADGNSFSFVCDPVKGWGASTGSAIIWYGSSGAILPGGWYHILIAGRDWGQTNARCVLRATHRQNSDSSAPAEVADFQVTNAVAPTAGDSYFTFSSSGAGPDIAEVQAGPVQTYHGPVAHGVDTQTLTAKVMCGYQGWFGAPGDGSGERGWRHWTKHYGPFADGNAKVDLWPDVSELAPDERFATGFTLSNGATAEVFSSYKEPTVLRHFQWMRDYGIDGAFVQRFAVGLRRSTDLNRGNTVLAHCRAGANQNGRAYAVMYDLSGLAAGETELVMNDWRALRREMAITEDPAYLHHHGKPVVAVWGIGFNDGRQYTLEECRRLVEFLKNDPESGGCTVMIGVPAHWRQLNNDAVSDPALLDLIKLADIVSPWTVGRYTNQETAGRYAERILKPDQAWCRQRNIDFLPVVFPGFSWHNMYGGPSNKIPRLGGKFLWSQFLNAKRAGASMIYVAMFDEVDEGTAIFKCANEVPVPGESQFISFDGLPSDYYLKLVGAGGKLLRGELSRSNTAFPMQATANGHP